MNARIVEQTINVLNVPANPHLAEITRFTFPAGTNYGFPSAQVENILCAASSTMTPGSYGSEFIQAFDASTLVPGAIPEMHLDLQDDGSTIGQSSDFQFNDPGLPGNWYVWINIDGGGSDPSPTSQGIEVPIASSYTNEQIADQIVINLQANGFFGAGHTGGGQVYWNLNYACTSNIYIDNGFPNSTVDQSVVGVYSPAVFVGGWPLFFTIDGQGGAVPQYIDQTEVPISVSDNANTVAAAIQSAMFNTNSDQWHAVVAGDTVYYENNGFGQGAATDSPNNPTNFVLGESTPEHITPNFTFIDPQQFGPTTIGVYFTIDGLGPAVGSLGVILNSADTAADVAGKLASVLSVAGYSASVVSSTTVRWSYTRSAYPTVDVPTLTNMPSFNKSVQTNGTPSPYILFNTTAVNYYLWAICSPNGEAYYGINPGPTLPGKTGILMFGGSTSDNSTLVATRFSGAIQDAIPAVAVSRVQAANALTITNNVTGAVTDASASVNPAPFTSGFTITVIQQGT